MAERGDDDGTDDLHSMVGPDGFPRTPLHPPRHRAKDAAADPAANQAGPSGAAAPRRRRRGLRRLRGQHHPAHLSAVRARDCRRHGLPPQTAPTIGDRLTSAGVDWAWYSGGWSNANGDVGASRLDQRHRPARAPTRRATPERYTRTARTSCSSSTISHSITTPPSRRALPPAPHTCATSRNSCSRRRSSTKSCDLKPVSFVKPAEPRTNTPATRAKVAAAITWSNFSSDRGRARVEGHARIVTYDEFGGHGTTSRRRLGGTPASTTSGGRAPESRRWCSRRSSAGTSSSITRPRHDVDPGDDRAAVQSQTSDGRATATCAICRRSTTRRTLYGDDEDDDREEYGR